MTVRRTTTGRGLAALLIATAALALPAGALAHDHADGGERPDAPPAAGRAADGQRAEGARPDGARPDRPARGQRGPSAAQLAAKLGLEETAVRMAMQSAHEQVRGITGKEERKAAFQAALATQLGLDRAVVDQAFTAVRADTLSTCVDRLLAKGVLTQAQADAIDAQIAAGELDAAHAAIEAAKRAAHAAAGH